MIQEPILTAFTRIPTLLSHKNGLGSSLRRFILNLSVFQRPIAPPAKFVPQNRLSLVAQPALSVACELLAPDFRAASAGGCSKASYDLPIQLAKIGLQ